MNRAAGQCLGLAIGTLFCAAFANATLIEVPPFTGDLTEDWESFPLTGPSETFLADPSAIMGGAAQISNPFMATFVAGSGFQLGSSGYPLPADGLQFMGIGGFSQEARITFGESVLSFGAYWGAWSSAVDIPGLVQITFLGENGSIVAQDSFGYLRPFDGVLEWHGWSFDTPVCEIVASGDFPTLDGLQANLVPEPQSAALIMFGAVFFIRWPRRGAF